MATGSDVSLPDTAITRLAGFVESLLTVATVEALQQRYIDSIDRLLPACAWGIYILDPLDQRVEHSSARGVSDFFLARYEEVGRRIDPLFTHLVQHRELADSDALMSLQQWYDSPLYTEVFHIHHLTRVMEAPVLLDGAVVGTLNFGVVTERESFSETDAVVAQALGRLVGAALSAVRARELTARERDAAQTALEMCDEPVAVSDLRTGTRRVNAALRALAHQLEVREGLGWIDDLMAQQRLVGDSWLASTNVVVRAGGEATLRMYSVRPREDQHMVVSVIRLEHAGPPAASLVFQQRLTQRERQVADFVVQGLRDAEIADRLCLSTNTVKHYLKSVYRKIGVASRVQLTRLMLDDAGHSSREAAATDGQRRADDIGRRIGGEDENR